MTNHIHLIVEPRDETSTVSELMKRLAGKQTRWVDRLEKRCGSLWEGRFKISPIDRDNYLLHCCRYIELNPVKAKMVEDTEDYVWSSYAARIGKALVTWVDDPAYLSLSPIKIRRQTRYKTFACSGDDSSTAMIQTVIVRNQLTGSAVFVEEIERRTGLRIETRGRGRPKK
jgi:putative transposase